MRSPRHPFRFRGSEMASKKIIPVLIAIAVVSTAMVALYTQDMDTGADEEIIEIGEWYDLIDAMNSANHGKTVKLVGNNDKYHAVVSGIDLINDAGSAGWSITLDLNGRTLNGVDNNVRAIHVGPGVTLKIKDSSEDGLGSIIRFHKEDETHGGSAIYNEGNVIIEGGVFRSNWTNSLGGAVYNAEGATFTIRDGIFGTNSTDQNGGAIYNKGMLRIEGGSFSGNCTGGQGGAIYNEGTVNILKCYMYMNEAVNGGGAIYNAEGGRLAVSNVFFTNNISKDGGAICNKSSTVWVDENGISRHAADIANAEMEANHAASGGSGGHVWNGGDISITNSIIKDGSSEYNGGGLCNLGTAIVTATTFENNKTTYNGGGIFNVGDGNITVDGCTFSGNTANETGGGMSNANKGGESPLSGATVLKCQFIDNHATEYGGGYANREGATALISDCTFTGNGSGDSGGGVYSYDTTIMNTTFEDNSAVYGGALCVRGTTDATNVFMTENDASEAGAIYVFRGTLNLTDSRITENSATYRAGAVKVNEARLNIGGFIDITGSHAPDYRNLLLINNGTIGCVDAVEPTSKIDLSIDYADRPITSNYDPNRISPNIFDYNGTKDFPFKEAMYEDHPELFCDMELWNAKLNSVLIYTWDQMVEVAKTAEDGTEVALADYIGWEKGRDDIVITKDIILDLNGYGINKNTGNDHTGYQVLRIEDGASVVIRDGRGGGYLTGAHTSGGGGAIYIEEGCKLLIESARIDNNQTEGNGAGIYTDGELVMTGGIIRSNTASNGDKGGAIYCGSSGKLDLSNVVIDDNSANDHGGAIYINSDYDCYIRNCHIHGNYTDENGGAIYMDGEKMLYIIDSSIASNRSYNDGAGIAIYEGGLEISGDTEISGNYAYDDGGAIYTDERKVVIKGNVRIADNKADGEGGAVYSEGIVEFMNGVEVSGNESKGHGGAVCLRDGSTVNIYEGAVFKNNHSDKNGGAIYISDNGNLNLWGGEFMYNSASGHGGAVCMDDDGDDLDVRGHVFMMYNSAVEGSGIYLDDDKRINVVGELTADSYIPVTLLADEDHSGLGKFTNGYADYNGANPANYFTSPEGYLAVKDGNEAALKAERSGAVSNESDFIDWTQQIVDYDALSDKNWMAGISGERRLNEINIPGTHDSALKSSRAHFTATLGDIAHMARMSQTQELYIDEQLNAGVRILDLRVNNQHMVPVVTDPFLDVLGLAWGILTFSDGTPYAPRDNGKDLWLCHGKDAVGGTFYGRDADGDDISLDQVLGWITNFLTLHPTEVIIVGAQAEVQGDDEDNKRITNERLVNRMREMVDEINPSTGKSFIYLEPGDSIGDPYDEYPLLKNCRGQIVFDGGVLGGLKDKLGDVTESYSQDVGFNCSIQEKCDSLERFFDEHVDNVMIPSDVTEHLTVKHSIGTNVGPTATKYYIGKYFESFVTNDIGPMHNAKVILGKYFTDGAMFDQRGHLVGWVKTDGATAIHNAYIWRSNFPGSGSFSLNYKEIRVESGLGGYDDQNYKLLKGTSFTVPGCIYKDCGKEFIGWAVGNDMYYEGDTYTVGDYDATFIAVWKDTVSHRITFVNYDDTVLGTFDFIEGTEAQHVQDVAPGAAKPGDVQYTYTFAGWDPAIADVASDATYKATYNSILNKYPVKWMSNDGQYVLESDPEVDYGAAPSYEGPVPTKAETVEHTFEFVGWSENVDSESGKPVSELPTVSGDATYYAAFKKIAKVYTITFVDWDGTQLHTGTYPVETTPDLFVPVNDPVRPESGGKYYEFKEWLPTPMNVKEDTTYTASYDEMDERRYQVTFMDWNAKAVSKGWYSQGTLYSDITPENPTREKSAQYSYTFSHWDPAVPSGDTPVSEDAIYRAVYDLTVNQYTVTFKDWDGTVLSENSYDYGTEAGSIIAPADPTREADARYSYTFAGWTPSLVNVQSNAEYRATYSTTELTYTIIWKNHDGTVLETDTDVTYGTIPRYNGAPPMKTKSEKYSYEFSGWTPAVKIVTADAEYTAEFREVGNLFVVKYMLNGGVLKDGRMDTDLYRYGDGYTLYSPDLVSKEYYHAVAWYDNEELEGDPVERLDGEAIGDKTFYLNWEGNSFEIWCMDFEPDGGYKIFPYVFNTEFTLPDPEEREGYEFKGWTSAEFEGIKRTVTIPKGSIGDRTYEAVWWNCIYDIEYYDGDTKLVLEPGKYTYHNQNALAQLPFKDGFTRVGWYTTPDFQQGTEITTVPQETTGTLTVYAKYTENTAAYWTTLPAPIEGLIFNDQRQVLITPGTAVGGTPMYSLGSEEFSEELPEALSGTDFLVRYKIDVDGTAVDMGWFTVTIADAPVKINEYPDFVEGLIYDTNWHNLIYSNGSVDGGRFAFSVNGGDFDYETPARKEAGDYEIRYMVKGDSHHQDSEIWTQIVTIAKGDIPSEMYTPPTPRSTPYVGSMQDLINPGSTEIGRMVYSLDGTNYSEDVPKAIEVGEYTVYYKIIGDSNYRDTEPKTVTGRISKEMAEWETEPAASNATYNGSAQDLLIPGKVRGGTAMYRLGNSGEYSTSVPKATDIGDYIVWIMIKGDSAHSDNPEREMAAHIGKGVIEPTVKMANWVAGDTPPTPVVTGNAGDGAVEFVYKGVTEDDSKYTSVLPMTRGDYNIKVIISETELYYGGSAVGTFSITKIPIAPRVTIEGWTYGGNPNEPVVKGNSGHGEVTFEYRAADADDSAYTGTIPKDAGDYVVRATIAETASYLGGTATANFNIAKAPAHIQANDATKTYGDDDPVFTSVVTGLVAGDDESAIPHTVTREAGKDVGTYVIAVTLGDVKNYNVTIEPATFTITKRQLTVKADDIIKTKGGADPELTCSFEGLVEGDVIEGIELTRVAGEDVGFYDITFVTQPETVNYDTTYVNGRFFILEEPTVEEHDDGTTSYTSEDEYDIDADTKIVILSVRIEGSDGKLTSLKVAVTTMTSDVDEHGKDRLTTERQSRETSFNPDGSEKLAVYTDMTSVLSTETDVEGGDILTMTTVTTTTEKYPDRTVVKKESEIKDDNMYTAALVLQGETSTEITTTLTNKSGGESVHLVDVKNAERQMTMCLDKLEGVSPSDRVMSIPADGEIKATVDNDAYARMGSSDISFRIRSDSGTITYSPDVASTFGTYDAPVVTQLTPGNYDSLTEEQKKAIPAGSFVVSVTATSGTTAIHELGGDCTMTFPLTAPAEWKMFDVFYIDPSGGIHEENTEYRDGMMSITMDHHSDFVLLQLFNVTVSHKGNGEASADSQVAWEGKIITLTATPSHGFKFVRWITDSGVTVSEDNTFVMPGADVSLTARFGSDGTMSDSDRQTMLYVALGVLIEALVLTAVCWLIVRRG